MRQLYPLDLLPGDDGTIVARFPDVPEALTFGRSEAEALEHAADALVVALSGYTDTGRAIPRPSRPRRGQRTIVLPPLVAAKLAIYTAMRDQKVTQAELAKRLGCDGRQVRRLLDLDHQSTVEQLDAALHALGKELVIEVRNAA